MKIYFVRHGETDYNKSGRIQGGMDIGLNDIGIEQAKFLGQKCIDKLLKFDAIFASPKIRASKTADIVSGMLGMTYELVHGLEEVDLGNWQGLTWVEVKEQYEVAFDEWYHNRRYTKAPSGESYQDMLDRVIMALKKIHERGFEQVLIVTHNAVIMCLMCLINETPFEKMTEHKVGNGELIMIDSSEI